jgi:DNA-binding transcriptional ArsR family regulator
MADSIRTITESRVLASMSHPARRRLLDALHVDGPSNVSMLAERVALAIGSASHHLRALQQVGLVEEAPELARDARERWFRAADTGTSWSTTSFADDPVDAVVAAAANSLNLEHHVSKVRAWQAQPQEPGDPWSDAAFSTDSWLHLTAAELCEVSVQINAVLSTWHTRDVPDDGAARRSVFVFAHGVPAAP